ncbi:hypothetical protein MTO96_018532 [Rhipicephalus appendiculatus]
MVSTCRGSLLEEILDLSRLGRGPVPGQGHEKKEHGHRYLGPGNPLRNGDPVDEDDGIAKSHDEVTWTSLRLTRHLRLSS